ncbi:MAG: methyl-accepting chemotaxis protein [Devosia sp.]
MFWSKPAPKPSLTDEVARHIYDHSPDAYCFMEHGKIVDCNRAMEAIMGCSRAELIGLRLEEISAREQTGGRTPEQQTEHLLEQMRETGFSRFEWMHQRLDGTPFPVMVTVLGATIDGRPMMISMWQDIKELVAARDLEQQMQARQAAAASALEAVVASMGAGLDALASGDLSTQIEEQFPQSYEMMRGNFNTAAKGLAGVLGRVVGAAERISAGLGDITSATGQLSARTDEQASAVTKSSTALNAIAASAAQVALQTEEMTSQATGAREDAEAAGAIVETTIGSMEAIQASSREVSNIVGVIDDIAFQTNLLALNAAVEAARAGDAGRSFAVVAAEVRRLAQRSAEAAKSIKSLIGNAGDQVDTGARLVNDTAEALRKIVGRIVHISNLVGEISKLTSVQANEAKAINGSISNIDGMTRSNAQMVEQTADLATGLVALANDLGEAVSRFRLAAKAERRREVA